MMTTIPFVLALLIACPAAAQISTIVPNTAIGGTEIVDPFGRTTGYILPQPWPGGRL
jgi:hypothetical protein